MATTPPFDAQTTEPRTTEQRQKGRIAGLLAATLVFALLLVLGPRSISVPDEPTGDPELATFLAEHAPRGAGNLTAFVIQGDQVRYAGQGLDETSEHEIGSITKTMVGEALHSAVESGSLSLDTTVGQVLGEQEAAVSDVTLRELAAHTSGLPRLSPIGIAGWARSLIGSDPYTGVTHDDVVRHALEADLSDRGQEEYSNFGVALLGHLLAMNAGTDFVTLMRNTLFTPLGMESTYVATDETVAEDAPRGRTLTGRLAAPWNSEGYGPAGSVRSTSRDMAAFARHVLASEREPISWVDETVGEHEVRWHNGGTGGYRTMLVVHRPTGTAAYVATDSEAAVNDLGMALFAHLQGIDPKEA